ncbi:hypothetical protein ACQKKK_17520 [Peribacillus sp. NPDC006672]|uniref:hypothetical protein n=1 Tax=Peribacillus sp. NPDC006672 TaxID=3390606 RepID=UPI003D050438
MLTNYENGGTTPRDTAIWTKLSEYFGVTEGYIMGVSENVKYLSLDDAMNDDEFIKKAIMPIEIKVSTRDELDLLVTISNLDKEDIKKVLELASVLFGNEKYDDKR